MSAAGLPSPNTSWVAVSASSRQILSARILACKSSNCCCLLAAMIFLLCAALAPPANGYCHPNNPRHHRADEDQKDEDEAVLLEAASVDCSQAQRIQQECRKSGHGKCASASFIPWPAGGFLSFHCLSSLQVRERQLSYSAASGRGRRWPVA